MPENLFETLQTQKQKLRTLAAKALEFGWIDATREQEIITKLDNDVLTIGVIGQMKCGKSTFLNAFVFEEDVLPAATTPMTAALTIITYGPEKKLVAEFYTRDEWEEQKIQAKRDLSSVSRGSLEESKIKAAKDLVKQAEKLGSSLDSYLGKTQSDSFDKLIEYVGADKKYVSITKAVTLYYPKEYLKGVEIVDTPGFNDPIVSREERTKAFLKKADVVLLMVYAGRPFDEFDSNILTKDLRFCGIGRVILGINKYDIPYEKGDSEDDILNYVKDQLTLASKTCNDDLMMELLKDINPIPISAQMALLSEIPMGSITNDRNLSFYWNKYCNMFEICTQKQMREKSHIDDLINAVKTVLEKEKEQILLVKPRNTIIATANKLKNDKEAEINRVTSFISTSKLPISEQKKIIENLERTIRKLNRNIDKAKSDLKSSIDDAKQNGKERMNIIVNDSFDKMDRIVNNLGIFESHEDIQPILISEFIKLDKNLDREAERLKIELKRNIINTVTDLLSDIEIILTDSKNDFDRVLFIANLRNEIEIEQEDANLFPIETAEERYGLLDFFFDVLSVPFEFINELFEITQLSKLANAVSHSQIQKNIRNEINDMRAQSDVTKYIDKLFPQNDKIIEHIRTRLIDELITPIKDQLAKNIAKNDTQEQSQNEALIRLETIKKEIDRINEQLNSVRDLID